MQFGAIRSPIISLPAVPSFDIGQRAVTVEKNFVRTRK